MLRNLILILALVLFNIDIVESAELEQIKKRGYLTIAVKNNLPPLAVQDEESNWYGLEIDIARRLAEEIFGTDTAVKFIPVLNQNRLQVVIDDKVDLTIAHVTANASRYRVVDFSSNYYLDGTGILSSKNNSGNSLTPDSSQKIAVLEGSSAIAVLRNNLPNLQLIGIKTYEEGLNLIRQGTVSGLAGDITVLVGLSQKAPQFKLLNSIYGGYPLAIVMPKGLQYQELRDKINTIMRDLKAEGWLKERAKYWGLPTFDDEDFNVFKSRF